MLELLHIENIAVIEEAEIAFRPGFNALTGETGAGKSIVIDAIGAVLGARTSRELIRTGADRAFVSAVFSGVSADLPALAENGVEADAEGNLALQREITADGRNVCRANGRPLTVAQLRAVGAELLNIHGQHDGQQLLDEEEHVHYLDRFAGTNDLLADYRAAFEDFSRLRVQIASLQMDETEKARRIDTLRYQIDELTRAELTAGEDEELAAKRALLRNGEKYLSALSKADSALGGAEEADGALDALRAAEDAVYGIRTLNDDLSALYERLQAARCEVFDLADVVREMREKYDFSPAELDAVESRTDLLYRLKKKYGATVEEMLEYLERCEAELESIETADDTIERLRAEEKRAEAKVREKGAALTAARTEKARLLELRIASELADLDMAKVRFFIEFTEKAPAADGCDQIRFLMSANVGEDLRPIARIASGGELARIMLALKNVFSEQESIGTMVFDEVDTGVSGRAAQRVAEKMARLSRIRQVLCVTHLPQIAAMADTHFSVEKGVRDGRTYTDVRLLDREARKRELARITGGSRVTPALLQSAGELLDMAEAYRKGL